MYNQFTLSLWHLSPPFLCTQNVCLSFVFRFRMQVYCNFFLCYMVTISEQNASNKLDKPMHVSRIYSASRSHWLDRWQKIIRTVVPSIRGPTFDWYVRSGRWHFVARPFVSIESRRKKEWRKKLFFVSWIVRENRVMEFFHSAYHYQQCITQPQ